MPIGPKVSALVAAWNEQSHVDAHMRSFLALRYPNIELIICAGGTDDTLERARRYACERVIVLEQHVGEGKQRALVRCLEHASGEILYLTDADTIFNDDALVRLLEPLVGRGEQVATGFSRPLDEQMQHVLPSFLWASDVVSTAYGGDYSQGLLGRNAALTRQALDLSGGLDYAAPTGTDYHLARRLLRAGFAIRSVPESVVASEYPETLRAYRRKQSRWLRNLIIYGWQYRAKHDMYVTIKTVVVGALMSLAPFSALVFGRVVLALWSLLFAHAVVSRLRYVLFAARLQQRRVSRSLLLALAPLTLIDFVVWATPIFDLLSKARRKQW